MKKVLLFLLMLPAFLFNSICFPGMAENIPDTFDEFSYLYLKDGTICITKYNGNDKRITVPAQISGANVTQIGELAFAEYEVPNIASLTLPNTIQRIGRSAFSGCSKLAKINLPEGLIEIGDLAFEGCSKLPKLTLPASLTRLGANPFADCASLSLKLADGQNAFHLCQGALYTMDGVLISAPGKNTSINIKPETTVIGAYAFAGNNKLKKVNIPSTVTEIRSNAFEFCSALQNITLPESLVSIGEHAFFGCEGLRAVELPMNLTNVSGNPFGCCARLKAFHVPDQHPVFFSLEGVLCKKEGMVLVSYPAAKGNQYTVPGGILMIGDEAFYSCQNLTEVHLPDTVTQIGEAAFRACIKLTVFDCLTALQEWANGPLPPADH